MVRADLQVIYDRLPKLSKKELGELRSRVELLSGSAPAAQPSSSLDDWLQQGIAIELHRKGLMAKPRFAPPMIPPGYKQASPAAQEFLLRGWGMGQPSYAERLALGKLTAACIVTYLTQRKVTAKPFTVLQTLSSLPVALDESFPGYWENGWLRICVTGMK